MSRKAIFRVCATCQKEKKTSDFYYKYASCKTCIAPSKAKERQGPEVSELEIIRLREELRSKREADRVAAKLVLMEKRAALQVASQRHRATLHAENLKIYHERQVQERLRREELKKDLKVQKMDEKFPELRSQLDAMIASPPPPRPPDMKTFEEMMQRNATQPPRPPDIGPRCECCTSTNVAGQDPHGHLWCKVCGTSIMTYGQCHMCPDRPVLYPEFVKPLPEFPNRDAKLTYICEIAGARYGA